MELDSTFDVACKREESYSAMFMDIRDFTTMSEKVSGKDCFNFMSNYYSKVEPVISMFKGFVYQYLGDGILSLFPVRGAGSCDSALHSAISLVDAVKIYNRGRSRAGYDPVKIGVGIDTGNVALGIAGTANRMSIGAYGHTVNLASRCESLAKKFNADIIISENTYHSIQNKDAFDTRYLGKQRIKGLQEYVGVYEVYNSNTPEMRKEKDLNQAKIEYAIENIENHQYSEAKYLLDELIDYSDLDQLPVVLKGEIGVCR